MINLTELEVTRSLYPEYLTDHEEWQEAMARLKWIHFKETTGNPTVGMVMVKSIRSQLGLATTKPEVSNATLCNYGYGLHAPRHPFHQGFPKGYQGTQG